MIGIQTLFCLLGPVLAVAEYGAQAVYPDVTVEVFFSEIESAEEIAGGSVLTGFPVPEETFLHNVSLSSSISFFVSVI